MGCLIAVRGELPFPSPSGTQQEGWTCDEREPPQPRRVLTGPLFNEPIRVEFV